MFRVALCCAISVLFYVRGAADPGVRRECRAGACDDRPVCPQSACPCIFPSRADCALYYRCVRGKPHQHRCSPGLLFNEEALTCDYDFNVNCSTGKTTRAAESSAGVTTTVKAVPTSEVAETTSADDATSDHPSGSIGTSTEVSSDDGSKKYSTETYRPTESNKESSRDTVAPESSDSSIGTANTELTGTQSESYSKYTGKDDTTNPDSSVKTTETSEFSTYSSSVNSLDTTYSKSSDFVTKITNSTLTTKQSEVTETTKSTSTTKEIEETEIAVSTGTNSDGTEISHPSSTTKTSHEPEATSSTNSDAEEPETTSFISTVATTSESSSANGSTGVTEHSLSTEEMRPEVTTGIQGRNWTCPSRFGLFPDERDCNKFYHCSHWKPYHKRCPSNLHFNPALEVCDWPVNAGCGERWTTSLPIQTAATAEPETTCECDLCDLPLPRDCNSYVRCANRSARVISCGRGLYFNPAAEACDREGGDPCRNDARCPESSGLFPYPNSCVHYMDCKDSAMTVKICPKGMIFDRLQKECSSGGSCEDLSTVSTTTHYSEPTNDDTSENFPLESSTTGVTQLTDSINNSTSSKTETISNINQTTVTNKGLNTETTFDTKATAITGQNIVTDKPNATHEEINSTLSIITYTAPTNDSKYTSENITKNGVSFSTPHSGNASEFTTSAITKIDSSTAVSGISPKLNSTTNPEPTVTETIMVSTNITSIETTLSHETSAKPNITSSTPEISKESSFSTEKFSKFPDETTSHSTTTIIETVRETKIISLPTTAQEKISTETISPRETTLEKEITTEVETTSPPNVSKETEKISTRNSTKLETTPFSVTEISSEETSTITNVRTFPQTEIIENSSATISNRETTTEKYSTKNDESTKDETLQSEEPEMRTTKRTSDNKTIKFECSNRFGLYPDPQSCFKFYHCSHWIAYHKVCPSNLHFNPVLQVCDWPYRAGCGSTTTEGVTAQTTSTPTQQTTTDGSSCGCDSCELPVPEDCNSYILCMDESATLVSCGGGLNFNVKTGTCDWEENVVCERNLRCPGPEGRFPYPHSCYHFMDCDDAVMTVRKCPEGAVYSKSEEECSWTAVCEDISTSTETTSSDKYETTGSAKYETTGSAKYETTSSAKNETTGSAKYETTGSAKYETTGSAKYETTSSAKNETTGSAKYETTGSAKYETTGSANYETTGSVKYEDTTVLEISTHIPTSLKTPKETSTEDTHTTYRDDTSSKLNSFATSKIMSTKRADKTSETSSATPTEGEYFSIKSSTANEEITTVNPTTASMPSESPPDSSNQDFLSTHSTEFSTSSDSFSTETDFTYSSTEKSTTSPATELIISTENNENANTSTDTSSFETASSIADKATANSADFTDVSTKRLVTITRSSTEISKLSSTEDPSAVTESSTNTASKTTGDYQKNTSQANSNVTQSTTEANANSSFVCPSRFGLYPDPESCFRFYHCSHWVAHRKWCPSGLHFSPKLQVCDWPYRAGCGELPALPTSETIQPKEEDAILNETCDCECCFYPNTTDCSKYTLCLDGVAHRGQCAEGLLFNPLDDNCDIAERVTCPCPSRDGVYPHPDLCSAFYQCVDGRPLLHRCPQNRHFKASEGKCADPCDARCDKTLDCKGPVCGEGDGLLPAEGDCSSYYQCAEGHAYFVKCPDGSHFNAEYGVCEPPCDARCDPNIDCPLPAHRAGSRSLDLSSAHCRKPNGLFPAAPDCGAFYLCSEGRAHLLRCPPGLHFSSKGETCEHPCNARCDKNINCTLSKNGNPEKSLTPSPHLPLWLLCKILNNGTLADPKSCASFYTCSDGKARRVPCPGGLHFDPDGKECKSPCLAGCDSSIQCPLEIPASKGECSCENCYLQDPEDCSAYLFCTRGVLTKGYCPRGTLFDRSSSECRNASEVVCEAIGDPSMCRTPSGNFPYPGNCSKFIRCEDSVAHVTDCEDGLEFDPAIRACANPKGHHDPMGKDPLCEKATGQFAHPKNSSLFYLCENGVKYLKSCSPPLIYNALDQVCDWPHNAQDASIGEGRGAKEVSSCREVPGVTCPCACRVTTYDDCDSFYQCGRDGRACERRCPDGLFFNRRTLVCDLPQNVECREMFFATIRRLQSPNRVKASLKYPF